MGNIHEESGIYHWEATTFYWLENGRYDICITVRET
jgi:hypothetical protein